MKDRPDSLRVRQVFRLDRQEANAIVQIYHDSFSPSQRIADSTLIGLIDDLPGSRRNAFYVAERGQEIVGFAYILFFPSFRMAHLMYLAIGKSARGHGAGRVLFDQLVTRCEQFRQPPHWITVEAIRPEFTADPDERASRETTASFLEEVGCLKVDADFQAPPLGPGLGVVPFWIMARPVGDPGVDPALVPDMLLVLYQLVYGLPEEHPLVVHCLRSVRTA